MEGDAAGESDADQAGMLKQYDQMQSQFEALGGYDYVRRIQQVLTGLAFGPDMWNRSLSTLSGGERTRAYLAGLLLQSPDLLMLRRADQPPRPGFGRMAGVVAEGASAAR